MALVLMIPLMLMVFYALKRCLDFAETNPHAAIMDGAELIVHEKLMFAQKNEPNAPLLEATVVDHNPPELAPGETTSPDPPLTQSLPQSSVTAVSYTHLTLPTN